MAKRKHSNWLTSFVDYARFGEAPDDVYFWVGVSCIAACLRRHVWLPMGYFEWIPNFYVIIVAPAGIIGKSTSIGIGTTLLKRVPGIKFGPNTLTWQSLVTSLANSCEQFATADGGQHVMSTITIESSEFGTLLNPNDRDMVDMLVHLWDGRKEEFWKSTKTSGDDRVVNPFINILAATTPDWIGGYFPEYLIGGGFTSRCIFVYAEQKARYVAYPGLVMPSGHMASEDSLVHDLEAISMITGAYKLEDDAVKWGENWYDQHYKKSHNNIDPRFRGYLARKQTHIHKLAMVIAASQRDETIITQGDLSIADLMVSNLEESMANVYACIGTSDTARGQNELVRVVQAFGQIPDKLLYSKLFRIMSHNDYISAKDSAIAAGLIRSAVVDGEYTLFTTRKHELKD